MTLLSRKVDYAILILAYPHPRAGGGSAREIADRFELSRSFVANILKLLCHKGFVASHRGVKGGYALQRPAEDVKLAELMDALDEGFYLAPVREDRSLKRFVPSHTTAPSGAASPASTSESATSCGRLRWPSCSPRLRRQTARSSV